MSEPTVNSYNFADFRFDGKRRRLFRGDETILLSPKATELLVLLLSHRGKFVTKEEIFAAVWPDTYVEDGVLTQNIYTLRKALGSDADGNSLVETKSRLGYRISVQVTPVDEADSSEDTTTMPEAVAAEPRNGQLKYAILAVVLIGLAASAIIAYRYWPVTTTETLSRLERVRIQKVTDTADIQYPTLSRDGKFVAYTRLSGIFVKSLETNVETKLEIPNVKRYGYSQFSADNNFLYLRNRASFLIPSDILKVSRFGGEATKIAENVWSGFSFSPDEKSVIFSRAFPDENRHALFRKDLETGSETELYSVNAPEEIRLRSYPTWSSDGERIALIIERQGKGFDRIVVLNRAGGQLDNLEFKNFALVDQVIWLPKKNVLLVSARETKLYQLWEITVATRKISRVTNDLNIYLSPTISADGTKLLTTQNKFHTNLWNVDAANPANEKRVTTGNFNRDGFYGLDHFPNGDIVYNSNEGESGDGNLWRINPATGEKKQLTVNAGKRNETPVVSPDAKFVFFTSDRGGKLAIWQIEADGENPKQITASDKGSDSNPQLSPDGQMLYFIRKTGKTSVVFRRSLTDGTEMPVAETEQYNPSSFLALSPDGKRLAFHSLTEKIQSDNPQQLHQIAVLELENPQKVSFYSMGGRKPEIFWTPKSDGFYAIAPFPGGDEIRLRMIDGNKDGTIWASFSKQEVYNLATDGPTVTVARGIQENDAVLLTNFE